MSPHAAVEGGRRLLGRYELLFRIARGGMAEVHAARMAGVGGFEKLVALKLMLPHLAEDERFVEMFLDEGRLAVHVSSPHVVQTLDLGQAEDGTLYLVMELVRGVSLSRALRNAVRAGSALPVEAIVEIVAQAAQGLDDAHHATTPLGEPLQLVHRDVSPQNLLLGVDGRVRIVDFGIARAVQRSTQTQAGEMKGKFAYFAPEQAMADAQIDHRVDIFALGIVAWECMTGHRLFKADNPAAQLDKVRNMPIPSVRELRPEVPAPVAEAVARALQRDPQERWPTAADFARALREGAREGGLPVAARRQIGELTRQLGGEQLARLEENLRRALSEPRPSFVTLSGERAPEPSTGSGVRSDSLPAVPSMPGLAPDPDEFKATRPVESPFSEADLAAAIATSSPPGAPEVPVGSEKPGRRRALPLVIGGAAVGLAAVGAMVWWLRPDEAATAKPAATAQEAAPRPPSEKANASEPGEPTEEPGSTKETPGAENERPTDEGEAAAGGTPLQSPPRLEPTGRRDPTRGEPEAGSSGRRRRASRTRRTEERASPNTKAAIEDLAARAARVEGRAPVEASPPTPSGRDGRGAAEPAPQRNRRAGTAAPTRPPRAAPSKQPQRNRRRRGGGPSLADVDDFEKELGL